MQEYLKYIGHKDALVSNELQVCIPSEVNKRVCDCLNCVDIKIINNQDRVASSLNKVPVTYNFLADWTGLNNFEKNGNHADKLETIFTFSTPVEVLKNK